MSINIIIATTNRPSLRRMIEALADQVTPDDFVTILYDGVTPEQYPLQILKCTVISIAELQQQGSWGHGIRSKYQNYLPGDWLWNVDDDDVVTPDALQAIRGTCTDNRNIYFFRFRHQNQGKIYWHTPGQHYLGNVGTPSGIIPNNHNLPEWPPIHGGDGLFMQKCANMFKPVWIDRIIYEAY